MIDWVIVKNGMRALPALFSFVMMLFFLAPMITGIVNLGNCAGAVISGVLTAVFVFYAQFRRTVSHLWSTGFGRVIICVSVAFIALGHL